MSDTYTIPQLKELITKAMQLGFNDDVAHWRALLAEQEGKNK